MFLSQELIDISKIIEDAQNKIHKINKQVVLEVSFMPLVKDDLHKVVDAIYKQFNFPRNDNSRKEIYLIPRMAIMYYLKKHSDYSFNYIGHVFGGKDHSSVIHSVNTCQGYIDTNQFKLKEMVEKIRYFILSNS